MTDASSPSSFQVLDLGLMDYHAAWDLQKQHHARVAQGGQPTLLLVEHPAVLTLGRKAAGGENIVVTREYLAAQGIQVYEIERGGDVTYHGPGQLVMYAIFPVGRKVRDFLRLLEQATLRILDLAGLHDARPNPGYAGVYIPDREINGLARHQKIASIGVAIKRHVALHGVGLNVATHLDHFDLIVPCGLSDIQMTSIEREYQLRGLGAAPDMEAVKRAAAQAFTEVFADYDWTLPALPPHPAPQPLIPAVGGPA
ncbi:lipoyl(octanoyl) transferase [Deinococcus irradiatisoli]|uniref:Octanoyltransferase n=1 Tax=Deinococcus irradiatisoli TaxID=2202254 RepID=A0A2Z3JKN5_9DEIO|nr:lipoyl(octanoyl) transferase LipB [Deinococcus irradiatisoli]AWN21854.1 lipoyl(octanoyl) transferase [Deinococcus irradiatisoli]